MNTIACDQTSWLFNLFCVALAFGRYYIVQHKLHCLRWLGTGGGYSLPDVSSLLFFLSTHILGYINFLIHA